MEFKRVRKSSTLRRVSEMVREQNAGADIRGRYFVTVEDGAIKGCVGVLRRSWYISEIRHLFVKPEFRRNGIGAFLVRESLARVKTPLAVCTVRADNDMSRRLFESAGFRTLEEVLNPDTGHTVLLMARKITTGDSPGRTEVQE